MLTNPGTECPRRALISFCSVKLADALLASDAGSRFFDAALSVTSASFATERAPIAWYSLMTDKILKYHRNFIVSERILIILIFDGMGLDFKSDASTLIKKRGLHFEIPAYCCLFHTRKTFINTALSVKPAIHNGCTSKATAGAQKLAIAVLSVEHARAWDCAGTHGRLKRRPALASRHGNQRPARAGVYGNCAVNPGTNGVTPAWP